MLFCFESQSCEWQYVAINWYYLIIITVQNTLILSWKINKKNTVFKKHFFMFFENEQIIKKIKMNSSCIDPYNLTSTLPISK